MAVFNADLQILIAPELAHTIGVQLGNAGISAGEDGKKIIKAGTPIGGTVDALQTRDTVLSAQTGANAQGVLLHDVDVTAGAANATMVVAGVVDEEKIKKNLGSAYATYITSTVKTALPRIIFQNGRAD